MQYRLVVGLGNPGEKYLNTRHNIGFMAIDNIAEKFPIQGFSNKFHSQFALTENEKYKIIFLKPQTYMNNSGIAVGECAAFYKITPNNILVIHDDLDLSQGRIKIKLNGGDGGHNGLKSIDQSIGKNYYRLRFGISKPTINSKISDYVLHNFSTVEMYIVNFGLNFLTEHFDLLLNSNYDSFLNKYALALRKHMEERNGI